MTSTVKVDTISENTSANGVVVDSVTLKDGGVTYGGGGSVSSLMTDIFRMSAELTTSDADITANLERADDATAGKLGSNMTESSGVFTFPSTGIYSVQFNVTGKRNGAARYIGCQIYGTANNGTAWDSLALSYESIDNQSAEVYMMMRAEAIFDCTDTSTHKVKFYLNSAANVIFTGDTNRNTTCMIFKRLGDT
jgi:hypothetical protein|tara:strand:+ start:1227 stop:1808 length:582 start_codon:yes stop_codon:yes gene_type:complete